MRYCTGRKPQTLVMSGTSFVPSFSSLLNRRRKKRSVDSDRSAGVNRIFPRAVYFPFGGPAAPTAISMTGGERRASVLESLNDNYDRRRTTRRSSAEDDDKESGRRGLSQRMAREAHVSREEEARRNTEACSSASAHCSVMIAVAASTITATRKWPP